MDVKNLLETAKKAALLAGERILEVYNSDDFDVEVKGDNSPLTKADKAAHNQIVTALKQTDLPVLSEEGADISYNTRKEWDYFWMVDPLDGTKEFIKRNGEFTVNIALIHKGKSILGVVYSPVLKQLFFASIGNGAFKSENSKEAPIKVSSFSSEQIGLRVVASRSHLNDETKGFIDQLKQPEIVSMGSSLKFMIVAEGNAEYYPRFAPTMEWDTAAAQIIVEEAGGSVIDQTTKTKVVYNKENLLNPYFLVSANNK